MESYRRICITGSKGMLGTHLVKVLSVDHEILALDLPEFDVTRRDSVRAVIGDFKPDLIIHCAAFTAVDLAESEVEKVSLVNALATRWMAQTAAELNAPLVYYSTDYVFCGSTGRVPFNEFMPTAPQGVYALSKFAGEEEVRTYQPRHYIIRTSWLYGPYGKNFPAVILKAAEDKPFLNVIDDQTGAPTHTFDLAEQTMRIVENGAFGLYHVSGNGSCTWHEYAKAVLEIAGIEKRIEPVTTTEYGAAAPRPPYSVLDHMALRNSIGDTIPHWRDSLEKYFDTLR